MPFFAQPDGTPDASRGVGMERMFEALRVAGFAAVQADLSAAAASDDYLRMLHANGLKAAPGYFHAVFSTPDAELDDRFDAALAASLKLDLGEIVVASSLSNESRAMPPGRQASGIAKLGMISRQVERLGRRALSRGIRLCFHQHIGTEVETADDLALLLEDTDPAAVWLCLDTGHLVWGGCADQRGFIERHSSRIGMFHVKDLSRGIMQQGAERGWSYTRHVAEGLWREPGDGDLDLQTVLRSWSASDLWGVVEVDRPARPTVEDSLRTCRDFIERLDRESRR